MVNDLDPIRESFWTRYSSGLDLGYKFYDTDECFDLILEVLKRTDEDQQQVGSIDRNEVWERGWKENLNSFLESGNDPSTLVPKFIRPNRPLRLKGKFIKGNDPWLELNFYKILRRWICNKFFRDISSVYEFGAGTGFNLLDFADLFPNKKYIGTDFVNSAVNLIDSVGKNLQKNISGEYFDMRSPNFSYKLDPSAAVFTLGSLEQLAGEVNGFFEYLFKNNPAICVHVEPDASFYDLKNLIDYTAYRFQTKRGYTLGLSSILRDFQNEGRLKIIESRRLYFGSFLMEGYNLFVWHPIQERIVI